MFWKTLQKEWYYVLKALLNNFLFNVTSQDFIRVSKDRTALKGSSVTAVYCPCCRYLRSAFKTTELIYLIKLLCGLCRYELPGINAFNFVLEDALGGGGVTSLRSDPQVKWKGFFCFFFFNVFWVKRIFWVIGALARPNSFAIRVEPKKKKKDASYRHGSKGEFQFIFIVQSRPMWYIVLLFCEFIT